MGEFTLEARGITKQYGAVLANSNVDFSVKAGEVHALLGENGAGKSTLVKILYGLIQPDAGKIFLDGKPVIFKNSSMAIDRGIGMVHQELMLIPYMTVADNVTLGREITRCAGHLDTKRAERELRELSKQYGFDIDPSIPVYKLPIGVQQRVEIIKLLYRKANILILDEPTALLTPQETGTLFEIIRSLKAQGKSIIFITHKLKEVYQITDRMTIMRGGRIITTTTPQETDEAELAGLMVGKNIQYIQYTKRSLEYDPVLSVKELCMREKGKIRSLDNVSFHVNRGEILGVVGIEGNGQTQLAQAILGLERIESGAIIYGGKNIANNATAAIRAAGVGSIPDDRQKEGLVLSFKIKENLFLNRFRQAPYAKGSLFQDWQAINKASQKLLEEFDIRAPGIDTPVSALSGGNQQKVVVGRELSEKRNLLVVSQPTRGVDVASATAIQQKIINAAKSGTAVLFFSSDLDEVLSVSDRIMVMLRGKNVGILQAGEATKERLGRLMLGVEEA